VSEINNSNLGAMKVISRSVDVAPSLKIGFGFTFFLASCGAGARVAVPVLLQLAIDNGLKAQEIRVGYVGMLAAIGALVVVLTAWCQRMAVIRLGTRSEQALLTLRVRLFEHIHRLSLANHGDEKRGALVSRVTSDIEVLQQFFGWGALAILLDGTLMIVVAAVMLAYDWQLSVVVFLISAPLGFLLSKVQRRLVAAYSRTREINADVLGLVSEMVAGAATLHAYGVQDFPVKRIAQAFHRRTKANVRASLLGAFLFPLSEVFAVLSVCGVVAIGVARGPASGLTSGALIGFIFLTYRFLEPIAEFTEIFDQTQSAVASLRRVVSVLDTPTGPPESSHPIQLPKGPLGIHIDAVSFAYRSRSESGVHDNVLHDINLVIPPGQTVALIGRTGSGKTTLGRLVGRFADPGVGSICIGGIDLRDVLNSDLRSRVMMVPQEPFLFNESIFYNLKFAAPSLDRQHCFDSLTELGLLEWLETLPQGIDTQVGERGSWLSAGERQLVALARAGLTNPDVLILDEATSSVDAVTEVRIGRALDTLSTGRTLITIAHRLATAARADRIVVMENGRIVQDGHHDLLVNVEGAYAQMFEAWVTATSLGES